jgi:ATP-dependent Clp protease ATP-binding subunit ClpA
MPEFRNRLDAIIGFDHLTTEVVTHVVNKFIFKLEAQLADRNVTIELSETARAWLATKGYDKQNGARPLARLIAEKIKKQLADEVLFGKLTKGGLVRIDVSDGELTFAFEKGAAPKKAQDEDSEELV